MAFTPTTYTNNTTMVPAVNSSTPLSPGQMEVILRKLNDEKAIQYLPVIIYMMLLLLVGSIGNIVVFFVYWHKKTKTSSHYFILNLAILDLLTCLVGMPTEVADLRYPYMFYAPAACKLLRFSESVSTIGSSITLIAVAFDRYYRICRLGKQISVKTAKVICVIAIIIGVATSWPACIIFGEKTVDVGIEGIVGVDCSTDDSMRHTLYPTLYYGVLFLLFIGCVIFFTVIYSKIGAVIWTRKKIKIGEKAPEIPQNKDRTFNDSTASDRVSSDPISTEMSSDQEANWDDTRRNSTASRNVFKKRGQKHQIRVTRTTVVLFAVTVAYVISFLPFLIFMVVRSIKKDFEAGLDPAGEVAYKFGSKSYFINNAINPVIYSFLNVNFRKDTKALFKRCLACCCCRNRDV
ncbi:orexin receptor type 2-like [Mizuhopecten yessoensis]|uniref:Orexin receptor type 2 n=1 Tax=Mizuhopecten yessoensis TaxID=6573 RepID=A0A210PF44_MIZYE|nr:orexin receptor type 2-like [Mizuhopecten yessoensis]XP_021343256.1 orexin receptor type 2-like [Mizuhopecten yessoensis]XP_021343257.1 orexin receptor type 2-like [Mizuhopecten yessoensis]XP_021343258.1 orexin receptor type 2-like [Mizuhopecten yessoensis]XP_021343260.1 orexin receptor type 2-like [Mizuhopecten yessoensis]XP_021343261.1 orexin receptor type 2-like [Mizuhopecten yessoensis]XP_021343262.1 orexin receptor type 2-like [Mizuhopecten yessoensis]XP_021343263.1 orexin receptor t